jgi:hypothetical protein
MKKAILTAASGAALIVAVWASSQPAPEDRARFDLDTIKQLSGAWVSIDEHGKVTDEVVSNFKVTAGGSAVIEMLFEGGEHEMVTLYHMEGEDLILTHYCMLGNQPRMKARAEGDKLVFECADNPALDCSTVQHMHRGEITFVDENRMKSAWSMLDKGEHTQTERFEVVRRR